jgi:hypothetical protein
MYLIVLIVMVVLVAIKKDINMNVTGLNLL